MVAGASMSLYCVTLLQKCCHPLLPLFTTFFIPLSTAAFIHSIDDIENKKVFFLRPGVHKKSGKSCRFSGKVASYCGGLHMMIMIKSLRTEACPCGKVNHKNERSSLGRARLLLFACLPGKMGKMLLCACVS